MTTATAPKDVHLSYADERREVEALLDRRERLEDHLEANPNDRVALRSERRKIDAELERREPEMRRLEELHEQALVEEALAELTTVTPKRAGVVKEHALVAARVQQSLSAAIVQAERWAELRHLDSDLRTAQQQALATAGRSTGVRPTLPGPPLDDLRRVLAAAEYSIESARRDVEQSE